MKYLSLLSIFSFIFTTVAQERNWSLVCHQPLHLGRPGLQHVRDACCPDEDPTGLPYTTEIQGCCCDTVYRKESNECCMPDGGCGFSSHHIIPIGEECKRKNCPLLPDFKCENGLEAGSTCTFGCAEGFTMVDDDNVSETTNVATCRSDFQWEVSIPSNLCCVPECPPLPAGTTLDFMIVLDKSSSIGERNWEIVIQFIHTMIDMVPLTPDSVRMSLVTYNNVAERIFDFADSFTKSKEELKNVVSNIIYSGRGTHTYLGLENVYENDIKNNPMNRPDVRDMLLVITDGKSRGGNRIDEASVAIKADNVEIYAIGVADAIQSEIEGMASEPVSKYTKMVSVFEELEDVAKSFLSSLCPVPTCD